MLIIFGNLLRKKFRNPLDMQQHHLVAQQTSFAPVGVLTSQRYDLGCDSLNTNSNLI